MRTRAALVLVPLALGFSLRAAAADDSSHNAPPPQTTNLIEQLNDPNPRRRHEAATALVSVKRLPPEAIAAMVRLPIVNDPSAQKALVEAGERAITVVTAAIDGPDPQLRLAALHLLGAMAKRRPKFWPLVIRVFRDEHADVALSATSEFSRLRVGDRPTPDAALVVPLLRQALRDSDPKVRMGAARAFAQIAPAKEDRQGSCARDRCGSWR